MVDESEEPSPSVFPGFEAMAADPPELIEQLASLRRAQGLSQTEVAARMGTSQSALARLESGRADIRLSTLQRYAEALHTTVGFAIQHHQEPDRDQS